MYKDKKMPKIKGKIDCVKNEGAIDVKMPQYSDEIRRAEYMMLIETLNKKYKKNKKDIDCKKECVRIGKNKKEVKEMKKTEKKVVSLTHNKSTHIVHLPRKWALDMEIENETQIVVEYDSNKKVIIISKL